MWRGEPHPPHPACNLPANFHAPGWWSSEPASWWQGMVDLDVTPEVHYVIGMYPRGTGNVVLTVTAHEPYTAISAKIDLALNGAHPHPGD